MKKNMLSIICLCLFFSGSLISASDDPDMVRAKIGIQIRSNGEVRRAKMRDRLLAGDRIRIYVYPEFVPAHIYVIHNDQKTITPLKELKEEQEEQESVQTDIDKPGVLRLPSPIGFYQVDGESSLECITIICSPVALPELARLLNAQETTREAWVEFEQELIEKSTIDLSDTPSKPWTLAAGLRGVDIDEFLEQLPIFSGKSYVVKKYEFTVKQ